MRKVLIVIILVGCKFFAQEKSLDFKVQDSIKSKTYYDLYKLFHENYKDLPSVALNHASFYLKKAKQENNDGAVAHGYYLVSSFYKEHKFYLNYADSIIQLTEDTKNYALKVRGYLMKGDYFLTQGEYMNAWENFDKAKKNIVRMSDSRTLYQYNRSIGALQSRLKNHDEALRTFKERYQYAIEEDLDSKFEDILLIAREFNHLKVLDSALHYNNLGYRGAIENNDKFLQTLFTLNSGLTHYHKKQYQLAIDSISKVLPDLKKRNKIQDLITAHLYLGKAYAELNLKDPMIQNLKLMDSIVQIQSNIIPNIDEGYMLMIKHFREQNNTTKESLYFGKLKELDSIIRYNTSGILEKNFSPHDGLLMISKKDNVVIDYSNAVFKLKLTIVVAGTLFLISIGTIIYLNNDRRRYKKSFRAVVSYTNKTPSEESNTEKRRKQQLDDLNISPDSIKKILEGIKDFETNQRYLNKKYTQNVLAKELKTNSTYLSKIINVYKEKNFSTYLHDLRIGYAIERLRDDPKFRLYSIKGISEEVGFKTSESFSKAFHKKTGIYPSSFMSKLKNT